MRPFAAGEAGLFFGRDRELGELITRLDRGEREIYVIGPSGSGKSSLVQAGLLPRLNTGSSRLGRAFVVRAMRPGERPLERLVNALDGDPTTPTATLDALLGRHLPAERVLVFVDQLEELFTLAGATERQRLIAALRAMRAEPRFHVLLALRADFYGALMDSELWPDDGEISRLDIGPLRGRALAQAIVEPAMQRGVYLEPRLCDRLVMEAASEPGALPLVQETLRILWDARHRRLLGLAEYEALGEGGSALQVAIAHHADAAMRTLSRVQQTMAHRVLLRLVSFGEGRPDTRRQQKLQALRSATDDDGELARVMQKLIEHRLLTIDRSEQADDALVDLSHEALISAWPALQRQIAQRRADEQQRRRLETKVEEWIERGRGTASLLDPVELVEAERWMASDAARELGYGKQLTELVAASRSAIEKIEHEAHATRHIVRTAYLERGTALLEEGEPLQALPYFVAARAEGLDGSWLRTRFAEAARHLSAIVLRGHSGSISKVAFSTDGTRLATASSDRTARIWNVSTAAPMTPPLEHLGAVTAVAFSRDGKRVVTGSEDNTARVWDAATGAPVTPPLSRRGAITTVMFSPDGERVLATSADRSVRVWDATNGVAITPPLIHSGAVLAATFGPDDAHVVTSSDDGVTRMWNIATGEPVPPLIVCKGPIHAAAFSPDARRVAIASRQAARLWDILTRKPASKPREHAAIICGLAFDRAGVRLVCASRDGTARIWDGVTGKPLADPLSEAGAAISPPFSLDDRQLVAASLHQARIWDVTTGMPVVSFRHAGAILDLALGPDGTCFATAGDDGVARIWNTAPYTMALRHRRGRVTAAVFSPDGTRIVTTGSNGRVRIWDATSGEPMPPPLEHRGFVTSAAFSRDGAYVVTGGEQSARAWSVTTGHPAAPPFEGLDSVNMLAFSPDGSRIVTAGWDYRARVWSATTGKPVTPVLHHRGPVNTAAFSPDGARVLTAGDDGVSWIWEAATGEPVTPPMQHQGRVIAASFSRCGNHVVTGSNDGTARIWNAATAQPVTPPLEHRGWVNAAVFHPDGTRVLTASSDGTARIWDVSTGLPTIAALAHQSAVRTAAFSPDGTLVVTASADHTAQIWDLATGKPLMAALQHPAPVHAAAFSPDGTRLVTASEDRVARLWHLPIDVGSLEDWRELARCSPFALVNGTLVPNPAPLAVRPQR